MLEIANRLEILYFPPCDGYVRNDGASAELFFFSRADQPELIASLSLSVDGAAWKLSVTKHALFQQHKKFVGGYESLVLRVLGYLSTAHEPYDILMRISKKQSSIMKQMARKIPPVSQPSPHQTRR